jgi:hypothetical protein
VLSQAGTTTRTIRIDRDVDTLLRQLSDEERVSVNHLVNRSLRKLVEWDSYADKFGVVSLPSALVHRMMDGLTEQQAKELGGWVGRNLVREFLSFWFKEVTLRTVMREYPRLNALYGKAFEYEEMKQDGRWLVILKHGGGRKWSTFYAEVLRTLFEEVVEEPASVEATENQILVQVASPPLEPTARA